MHVVAEPSLLTLVGPFLHNYNSADSCAALPLRPTADLVFVAVIFRGGHDRSRSQMPRGGWIFGGQVRNPWTPKMSMFFEQRVSDTQSLGGRQFRGHDKSPLSRSKSGYSSCLCVPHSLFMGVSPLKIGWNPPHLTLRIQRACSLFRAGLWVRRHGIGCLTPRPSRHD